MSFRPGRFGNVDIMPPPVTTPSANTHVATAVQKRIDRQHDKDVTTTPEGRQCRQRITKPQPGEESQLRLREANAEQSGAHRADIQKPGCELNHTIIGGPAMQEHAYKQ